MTQSLHNFEVNIEYQFFSNILLLKCYHFLEKKKVKRQSSVFTECFCCISMACDFSKLSRFFDYFFFCSSLAATLQVLQQRIVSARLHLFLQTVWYLLQIFKMLFPIKLVN